MKWWMASRDPCPTVSLPSVVCVHKATADEVFTSRHCDPSWPLRGERPWIDLPPARPWFLGGFNQIKVGEPILGFEPRKVLRPKSLISYVDKQGGGPVLPEGCPLCQGLSGSVGVLQPT